MLIVTGFDQLLPIDAEHGDNIEYDRKPLLKRQGFG
jgi:hypothetical protein